MSGQIPGSSAIAGWIAFGTWYGLYGVGIERAFFEALSGAERAALIT